MYNSIPISEFKIFFLWERFEDHSIHFNLFCCKFCFLFHNFTHNLIKKNDVRKEYNFEILLDNMNFFYICKQFLPLGNNYELHRLFFSNIYLLFNIIYEYTKDL